MTWAASSSYALAGEPQEALEAAVLGVLSIGGTRTRWQLARWLMEHGATATAAHLAVVTLIAEGRVDQGPSGQLMLTKPPTFDYRPGQMMIVTRTRRAPLWRRAWAWLFGRLP